MIKRRIPGVFFVLAALALACGSGFAQDKKEISLTLEDSILRALKNNLNVAAEVINPGRARESVALAQQIYSPTLALDLNGARYEQPSLSYFQTKGTYINRTTGTSATLSQRIPFGGTFQAQMSYDYAKNNGKFVNFNPYYQGALYFSLTQPLLKNFGWTVSRKEIIIAQNNFEVSRSQFRDTLVTTVYSVESAYWNLVYSIENLKTLRMSLDSGKDLLAKTKREVQVGTKAPIEVLNAEATVARREADILQAEALVKRSQDQLRTLLNLDVDPSALGTNLVPADKPEFKPYMITLEDALAKAMTHRPDLDVAKSTIALKQVNFRVAKNQRLPQLDLRLTKTAPGISGQQYTYDPDNPFAEPAEGPSGSAREAFRDAFKFLYNNWTAGVTLTVPFGDVFGKAQYAYAKLDLEQAQARLKTQEQQVFLEVSDAVRSLETAAKSVDAYRIARELAEKQLEFRRRAGCVRIAE